MERPLYLDNILSSGLWNVNNPENQNKVYILVSFHQDTLNQHIPEPYCLILNDLESPSSQSSVIQSILDQFKPVIIILLKNMKKSVRCFYGTPGSRP